MTTTLPTLDDEQQAALTQLSADHASPEAWATAVLLGLIDEQVTRNIDNKGRLLLDLAKQLPKEKRLSFSAQTETLYTTIASEP